jgi:hypothetical protein
VKPRGGPGEGAAFDHLREIPELAKVHAWLCRRNRLVSKAANSTFGGMLLRPIPMCRDGGGAANLRSIEDGWLR